MRGQPPLPGPGKISAGVVIPFIVILGILLLTAGCTEQSQPVQPLNETQTTVPTPTEKSLFFYGKRIPQEESINPDFIKIDSDIFHQGEILRFYVFNEGNSSLACDAMIPYFLYQQVGKWELLTKQKTGYGWWGEVHDILPGESTPVEQLNTANLEPGHYKIVKCGVSREFEVHTALKNTTKSR